VDGIHCSHKNKKTKRIIFFVLIIAVPSVYHQPPNDTPPSLSHQDNKEQQQQQQSNENGPFASHDGQCAGGPTLHDMSQSTVIFQPFHPGEQVKRTKDNPPVM